MSRPSATTHECPGGCGAEVPQHQLACRTCWRKLPEALRHQVNVAYRNRYVNRRAHIVAMHEALQWLRTWREAVAQ